MLDTDICIHLIRHRPKILLQRIMEQTPGSLVLSSITVAELQYGVRKSRQPELNHEALRLFLRPFDLLPFDTAAAERYGRIRATLELQGLPIGPLDTLIGSHALHLGAILVTHNLREFSRIEGLRLEDWVNQ